MPLKSQRSRPAASRFTRPKVLALYYLFQFAGAATSIAGTSPNAPRLTGASGLQPTYEPDFDLFGRDVIGRAPPGVQALKNNIPERLNLQAGKMACYLVEKSMLFGGETSGGRNELRAVEPDDEALLADPDSPMAKRQTTPARTIYLSANTCLQPRRVSSANNTNSPPPQLWLSVSMNSEDGCPDPSQVKPGVRSISFEQGAATLQADVTGDIYIGVQAPNISAEFEDVYNFELVASVDDYYHKYENSTAELLWIDSDANSVLLMTRSLTQNQNEVSQIMKQAPPYELFVQNDIAPSFEGMRHSVCGIKTFAAIAANREGNGQQHDLIRSKMTTQGPGNMPKQQFYLEGLNASSSYTAVLLKLPTNASLSGRQEGSGSTDGRGTVFEAMKFETLSGTNCQVVTDLEFCDEIQYAAPGNDNKFNNTELARKYDDYAKKMYANFKKVMMQIPCDTDPTSQYSLARNCDNCTKAYKRWLCTVSIPRCEAFNSNNNFTVMRNVGQVFPDGTALPEKERQQWEGIPGHNASRNSFIDTEIQPGPYREILPCDDVCYEVVQSCPSAIGFQCPQPGMIAFDVSYGERMDDSSVMTCNYPGEARTRPSAAGVTKPQKYLLAAAVLVGPLLGLLG